MAQIFNFHFQDADLQFKVKPRDYISISQQRATKEAMDDFGSFQQASGIADSKVIAWEKSLRSHR